MVFPWLEDAGQVTVRLLAHGGTLLGERARIGKWPEIHPALLEEKYGLRGGKRILGVGVAGGEPFLIIRELQANVGRMYSFTLLIDPGQPIWERFSWSAGTLLQAFLDSVEDAGSAAARMFLAPEQLTAPDLDSCISALAPRAASDDRKALTVLAECMAGSIAQEQRVTLAPSDLGLDGRPGLADITPALDRLPRWLRIGRGWMCGGGVEQAEALGAHLVFDDESPKATADVAMLRAKGSWTIDVFRKMDAHPRLKGALEQVPPAWAAQTSANGLETLAPISAWLNDASADGAMIRMLSAPAAGPLRAVVEQAAQLALSGGTGRLDAETTRSVLRYFAGGEQSVAPYAHRLDKDAVREVIRRDFNGRVPPYLGLPDTVRLEIQLQDLEKAQHGIVARLRRTLGNEEWSAAEKRLLLEAAWARSVNLGEPMRDWTGLRHESVWPEVVQRLSALASSPLRAQIPLDQKVEIAQCLVDSGDSAWRPFLCVVEMMSGENVAPMPITAAESAALREEMPALLKSHAAAPNLQALIAWDGLLDDQTGKLIARYRVDAQQITPSWLSGLAIARKRGWIDDKTYELNLLESIEHRITADTDWSMNPCDVSEAALSDWVYDHLFEPDQRTAHTSIKIMAGLCKQWALDPVFQRALSAALSKGVENEDGKKAFSKRFLVVDAAEASERLEPVFAAIPHAQQHEIVEALFADEDQPIPELVGGIIDGEGSGRAFRRAVLEFVIDRHKHVVKQLLAKSQFGGVQKKMKDKAAERLKRLAAEGQA